MEMKQRRRWELSAGVIGALGNAGAMVYANLPTGRRLLPSWLPLQ